MGIDTSIFEKAISEHMEDQPYELKCSCGNSLNFSFTVDNDLDLKGEVEPCKDCLDEQFNLGQST